MTCCQAIDVDEDGKTEMEMMGCCHVDVVIITLRK